MYILYHSHDPTQVGEARSLRIFRFFGCRRSKRHRPARDGPSAIALQANGQGPHFAENAPPTVPRQLRRWVKMNEPEHLQQRSWAAIALNRRPLTWASVCRSVFQPRGPTVQARVLYPKERT